MVHAGYGEIGKMSEKVHFLLFFYVRVVRKLQFTNNFLKKQQFLGLKPEKLQDL
jgi:hypothetical protein